MLRNLQIKSFIANVHSDRHNYDQAMKLFEESLSIKKEIGDYIGIAATLYSIADEIHSG